MRPRDPRAAAATNKLAATVPVVGRNAFTHVAKLHKAAMAKDWRSSSWTDPATLGRETELAPDFDPKDPKL